MHTPRTLGNRYKTQCRASLVQLEHQDQLPGLSRMFLDRRQILPGPGSPVQASDSFKPSTACSGISKSWGGSDESRVLGWGCSRAPASCPFPPLTDLVRLRRKAQGSPAACDSDVPAAREDGCNARDTA